MIASRICLFAGSPAVFAVRNNYISVMVDDGEKWNCKLRGYLPTNEEAGAWFEKMKRGLK